jgi:hypothetical protein
MLGTLVNLARTIRDEFSLPALAKAERRRDTQGLTDDIGVHRSVVHALNWICRAQDCSATQDGGVARHYSLLSGWAASYPETTGYIIPTMIECAKLYSKPEYLERAQRMLDWLVSIQMESGAFQGGMVNQKPVIPVTFNTGQILLGLAAGVVEFGDKYRAPMDAAARWLAETQDPDGAWRRYISPFTATGDKVYDTHVAWGLFEAARITPEAGYEDAAFRNVRWAISRQQSNGWFADCDLNHPDRPLTHTIGYVLRGILEAYRYQPSSEFLDSARTTADRLIAVMKPDGMIPGRLNRHWESDVSWVCLTGNCQIALCWLILYQITNETKYLQAARTANRFVRRTIRLDVPLDQQGGIKGSFPVSGEYGHYEYLNWAAKFFIDSNLLEDAITKSAEGAASETVSTSGRRTAIQV